MPPRYGHASLNGFADAPLLTGCRFCTIVAAKIIPIIARSKGRDSLSRTQQRLARPCRREMTSGRYTIVGLGEIVWDLLPAGPQLGGAPANFAYFANLLGNHRIVARRVGTDELGHETLQRLHQSGLP